MLSAKNNDKENILNILLNKDLENTEREEKQNNILYNLFYHRIQLPFLSTFKEEIYTTKDLLKYYQLKETFLSNKEFKEKLQVKFFVKIISIIKEDPKLLAKILISKDKKGNNALMQSVATENIDILTKILESIKDDKRTLNRLFKNKNRKRETVFEIAKKINDEKAKEKIISILNQYKK